MTVEQNLKSYRIELSQILSVYRKVLSYGCLLVAGFFSRTVATKDGTLAIGKDGTFYYNPEWCQKWLTNPTRFEDGILHEMLHPVIGDMSREMSELRNFASDAVINAMIYNLGLSTGELFENFYSGSEGIQALLRPNSQPPKNLRGVYLNLYGGSSTLTRAKALSTLDVSDAIRVICPDQVKDVTLIGSHASGQPTQTADGEPIDPDDLGLPADVQSSIAETMADNIANGKYSRPGAGYGSHTRNSYIDILLAKASLKRKVYDEFICRDNINKLIGEFSIAPPEPSVVPTQISRRDALLISQGVMPVFYNVSQEEPDEQAGLHVYMDVSGSVWSDLPRALGVIRALHGVIDTIYQFSNVVVRTSVNDMVNGKKAEIDTTGGTDFDCVIEHAIENGVKKALVFTDGDAGCKKENQERMKQHIEKMGIVYFGSYINKKNWLHTSFSPHFKIDDLIEKKHVRT